MPCTCGNDELEPIYAILCALAEGRMFNVAHSPNSIFEDPSSRNTRPRLETSICFHCGVWCFRLCQHASLPLHIICYRCKACFVFFLPYATVGLDHEPGTPVNPAASPAVSPQFVPALFLTIACSPASEPSSPPYTTEIFFRF